jgi:hypothetical protein
MADTTCPVCGEALDACDCGTVLDVASGITHANPVAMADALATPALPVITRDPCDDCWMLADGCIGCEHASGRRGKR